MQPQEPVSNGAVKSRSNLPIMVVVIVLVLLGLVAAYGLGRNEGAKSSSTTTSSAETYKQTYSTLSLYQLEGTAAGTGMSFEMPKQIGVGQGSSSKSTQTNLTETSTTGNINLADVSALTSQPAAGDLTLLKEPANQDFSNSGSYGSFMLIEPAKRLAGSALDLSYGFSFAAPVSFTNSNIKSNAWSIDFSASTPTANSSLPPMQGEMVVAIGKNGLYYFVVNAVNYNWTGNQGVWQQVLGSLKIDQ